MRLQKTKICSIFAIMTLVGIFCSGMVKESNAAGFPYGIIAPHEFNLPVDYEPFNAFVQYGLFNNNRRGYDGLKDSSSTLLSLSKYARFFKIDALPNVGFLWEVLLPAVSVIGDDGNTGFADPQVGVLAWVRPIPNLMTGLEWWLQLPFGDNEFSDHAIDNIFSFVWDYQCGKFNFGGVTGITVMGDYRHAGWNYERGESLHASIRFAYEFARNIEPWVGLDYQTSSKGKAKKDFGGYLHKVNKGDTVYRSYNELAASVGLHFQFTSNLLGDVFYMRGFEGSNTLKTDAVHMKLAYVF